ncbi:MAG: 50S ribosomal protein L15 [Geminicoccaceae bacterium]
MKLNELTDKPGARKVAKRVGRGIGSGKGKTCGKGHKGQKSRSGGGNVIFEGGQMPIYRRLPKRGFNNHKFKTEYQLLNLDRLQAAADAGKFEKNATLDAAALVAAGLVRQAGEPIKLLARGDLRAKLTLQVDKASPKAVEAVNAAGGSVQLNEPTAEAEAATETQSETGEGAPE